MEPGLINRSAVAVVDKGKDGTHTYNNTTKQNWRIYLSQIYVPKQPWHYFWGDNHYRSAFTHEIGHGIGWFGHSNDSNDLMHNSAGTTTVLTNRDKNHLNQNY